MKNIVITMAGLGSRFRKAGYTVPKYEIEAHGATLFEWSMQSLANIISPEDKLIFVTLKEHNSIPFVTEQCKKLGHNNIVFHELSSLSDGQATSALLTSDLWQADSPVVIYNIDTYVEPEFMQAQTIPADSDGWVPCFKAEGDHWSFIKTGTDGWATDAAEKIRISDNATVGLYWFSSGELYREAYNRLYSDFPQDQEKYIAPMYKTLIEMGKKVSICDIPVNAVHALGTPAELQVFLAKDVTP